jgi:hypothetical protein
VTAQLAAALAASVFLPFVVLAGDCPSCGIVSVSVVGANGEIVQGGAYLALAPADGSFREPVAEALSDGSPPLAVWRVQPGTYRAACLARGFGFSSPPPFGVSSGETVRMVCTVVPASTLTGRVLSQETREPIEGATVTPLPFVVPRFATKWSDLAQEYLRRIFGATTDKQGFYSVFVLPKSRNVFLFEATGAASKRVDNVVVGESPAVLADVVLPQAGVLQVMGSFPPSVDPEKYVAIIYSFSQGGFDKAEDEEFLRRRLGPDGIAEWRSLAPGYWAVRLDTGDGHRLTLGSAHVTANGLASLEFGVAGSRLRGVVKGIPSTVISTGRVLLTPGHRIIESGLSPSPETGRENEATFETRLWLPGVYGAVLYLGSNRESTVALGTVTARVGAEGAIERTFELPSRGLGGVVLNEIGTPVKGAQVLVCTDDRGLFFDSEACVTSSDASGHWRCSWLPAGKLLALARAQGAGVSRIETVEPGTDGNAVTLRLTAGATISGQLVVPGDADPANSLVGFACEAFPALLVQGRTASGGHFELADLPRCNGQLIVRPNDKTLAFVWRQVAANPQTDVGELRAERAGAVFAVGSDVAPQGAEALLSARLFFRGTRLCNKLFGAIGGVGTGFPNFPGAAGYFYKLPPGPYRIEWTDLDRKVVARSADFEVRAGEMREVSFVVAR